MKNLDVSRNELQMIVDALEVDATAKTRKLLSRLNRALGDKPKEPLAMTFDVRYKRKDEVDHDPDEELESQLFAKGWRDVWDQIEKDDFFVGAEIVAVERVS